MLEKIKGVKMKAYKMGFLGLEKQKRGKRLWDISKRVQSLLNESERALMRKTYKELENEKRAKSI